MYMVHVTETKMSQDILIWQGSVKMKLNSRSNTGNIEVWTLRCIGCHFEIVKTSTLIDIRVGITRRVIVIKLKVHRASLVGKIWHQTYAFR